MNLKRADYTITNGTLVLKVHSIYTQTEEKVRFKASLYNKMNGYVYETKTYRMLKKNMKHWKRWLNEKK